MRVASLKPGDAFRVDIGNGNSIDYRLIYVNDSRAYVESIGKPKRVITSAEGEKLAEFDDRGRCNISPGTECSLLDGRTAATRPAPKGRGQRPQVATRPVKPGTVRAKILEYLLDDMSGETNLNDIMMALDIDRPLLLSHIWELWHNHGYGYHIAGDVIVIENPLEDDAEDML